MPTIAKPSSPAVSTARRFLLSSSRSYVVVTVTAACLISFLVATSLFGSNNNNATSDASSSILDSPGITTLTPFVATPPVLTTALQGILPSSLGIVSCTDVHSRVERGEWEDPNQGYVYARRLVSDPPFMVAVHQDSYDHMRWKSIYLRGAYYETQVHQRFVHILKDKPSSLVIDVGMNIGYYSLLSAQLGHSVVGFEINPANLMRMCESLDLNHNFNTLASSSPVAMVRRGVSDVDGQVLHLVVPKNPGEATLESTSSTEINAHSVSTITLDTFATEQKWFDAAGATSSKPKIRLLKIDVEGHEPEIIFGAEKLLKSGLVQNILTEYRDYASPKTRKAFDILLAAGYTVVHEGVLLTRQESETFYDDLLHNRVRTKEYDNVRKKFKSYFRKQLYSDLWFSCPTCESGATASS